VHDTLKNLDPETLASLALDTAPHPPKDPETQPQPICDRCHNLLHHHQGVPIYHPSIQSIQSIIEESPHKHNHIYHILDAADFPLSLIPSLQHDLRLPRLRTQNRRAKTQRFLHGRVAEVSFVITRSDLLAPRKEQVDALLPYLRDVLRDALGSEGRNLRLGNVRCVSAMRGWWTSEVKEAIWKRGGAGWMVGKVNVGKSQLFEVVFPRGRGRNTVQADRLRLVAQRSAGHGVMRGLASPGAEVFAARDRNGELEEIESAASHDEALDEHDTTNGADIVSGPDDSTNTALKRSDQVRGDDVKSEEENDSDEELEETLQTTTDPPSDAFDAFDSYDSLSLLPPPQPRTTDSCPH